MTLAKKLLDKAGLVETSASLVRVAVDLHEVKDEVALHEVVTQLDDDICMLIKARDAVAKGLPNQKEFLSTSTVAVALYGQPLHPPHSGIAGALHE